MTISRENNVAARFTAGSQRQGKQSTGFIPAFWPKRVNTSRAFRGVFGAVLPTAGRFHGVLHAHVACKDQVAFGRGRGCGEQVTVTVHTCMRITTVLRDLFLCYPRQRACGRRAYLHTTLAIRLFFQLFFRCFPLRACSKIFAYFFFFRCRRPRRGQEPGKGGTATAKTSPPCGGRCCWPSGCRSRSTPSGPGLPAQRATPRISSWLRTCVSVACRERGWGHAAGMFYLGPHFWSWLGFGSHLGVGSIMSAPGVFHPLLLLLSYTEHHNCCKPITLRKL